MGSVEHGQVLRRLQRAHENLYNGRLSGAGQEVLDELVKMGIGIQGSRWQEG